MLEDTRRQVREMIEDRIKLLKRELGADRKLGFGFVVSQPIQSDSASEEVLTAKTVEEALQELDIEDLYEKVAQKIVERILQENKEELMDDVCGQVAEMAWDDLDWDELYPAIGEKVVVLLKAEKKEGV